MEINNRIKSYQAGGYMTYQPLPMIPEAAQQPLPEDDEEDVKGKGKDEPYMDKTTMNKMLGQGITTDVMAYSNELNAAQREYENMNDFQRNSFKGKQLRSLLKGDMGTLNALMRGKKTLDESINNAKSNGALEEYAVTSNGMVVKDMTTNKITQVSFSEFAADNNSKTKKFQALTNAQLAEEREYNKQLIGNTGVYSILNFGKGMEKVKEEIVKVANNLGSTKRSVTNATFERNDAADIQELITAAKQGVFKVKSGESIDTNSPQIEAAKMTMWVNLSDNSKSVLRARAAMTTTNPAQIEKMAQTMAASLLDPMASETTSKVYDETLRAGAKGSGAGSGEKMANMGPTEMAFHGRNDTTPLSMIGDYGVKMESMAYALPTFLYTDNNNKRVPLSNAGKLNQVGYLSKAFTANGDPVASNQTMITGDAYFARLPVYIDSNGAMKLDEENSKKWASFEAELNSLPASQRTPLKESELKQKYGVENLRIERLIVAEAASYDTKYRIFSDRDERYYKKLDKETERLLGETVDPDKKGPRNWIDYSAHKHLVFIPAKEEASARFADGNSARVADRVYDVAQGFNTGNTNSTIYGQPSAPANFTADIFKNK